jgi:glucosamine-phosphate N-acetyltransferase|tara:strand:+ start:2614 stop:3051 length:438 start_codon:yes stop_codon:yes gene_type:complete
VNIIKDKELIFRLIERKDLKVVFPLLNQLTIIDHSSRDKDKCWDKFIYNNASTSIVGIYKNKIIAYGSIIIENKIRGGSSGHIEDIIVDKSVRGKNIGVKLIEELIKIGKSKDCYRITLFCKKSLINFYNKNGFNEDYIAMKKFL